MEKGLLPEVILLAYRKVFGGRIRFLREQCGWSQVHMARQIPLSQKQLSRLELGDVSFVDRRLLIRLGEIFENPIASGELTQWLHAFGYRPYVVPLLPLPPNHEDLLAHYAGLPAGIIDMGRYIRYINRPMERLYHVKLENLVGARKNWLWQYFHPDGFLNNTYPPDSHERVLNRLFWDWAPYYHESWNYALRRELEKALKMTWSDVQHTYHIPTEPFTQPLSERVSLKDADGMHLMFQANMVHVPFRPDLYIVVYHPQNETAAAWCTSYASLT